MKKAAEQPNKEKEPAEPRSGLDLVGLKWPLVRLAAWLNLPPASLRDMLLKEGEAGDEGFDVGKAVPLAFNYLRTKMEQNARVGDEAATRRKVAEAETAEIDLEKKRGTIISVDQARRIIESHRISIREIVRVQDGMTSDQRNDLCDKIAGVDPFDGLEP